MPEEPPRVPKGSIVLIDFPFTDLFGEKLRPALVRWAPYFEGTGLKKDSILLIDKIATIEKTFIKAYSERPKPILGEGSIYK